MLHVSYTHLGYVRFVGFCNYLYNTYGKRNKKNKKNLYTLPTEWNKHGVNQGPRSLFLPQGPPAGEAGPASS